MDYAMKHNPVALTSAQLEQLQNLNNNHHPHNHHDGSGVTTAPIATPPGDDECYRHDFLNSLTDVNANSNTAVKNESSEFTSTGLDALFWDNGQFNDDRQQQEQEQGHALIDNDPMSEEDNSDYSGSGTGTMNNEASMSGAGEMSTGTTTTVSMPRRGSAKKPSSRTGSTNTSGREDVFEDEMTAKKKREQNRAAQRAFRERKETKLKQLSEQLTQSEVERQKIEKEVEMLRRQNIVLKTENRVLLKSGTLKESQGYSNHSPAITAASMIEPSPPHQQLAQQQPPSHQPQVVSFPYYTKTNFITDTIADTRHDLNSAMKYDTLVYENDGTKLMTLGAVWDYLHNFSAENEDLELDIDKVMNLLKGNEVCHGYGPGYPIKLVEAAIDQAVTR